MGSLRVVESLAEALADTVGSVGFTRRAGGARVTHASLRQLLMEYPEVLPERGIEPRPGVERTGIIALVFGYVAVHRKSLWVNLEQSFIRNWTQGPHSDRAAYHICSASLILFVVDLSRRLSLGV